MRALPIWISPSARGRSGVWEQSADIDPGRRFALVGMPASHRSNARLLSSRELLPFTRFSRQPLIRSAVFLVEKSRELTARRATPAYHSSLLSIILALLAGGFAFMPARRRSPAAIDDAYARNLLASPDLGTSISSISKRRVLQRRTLGLPSLYRGEHASRFSSQPPYPVPGARLREIRARGIARNSAYATGLFGPLGR